VRGGSSGAAVSIPLAIHVDGAVRGRPPEPQIGARLIAAPPRRAVPSSFEVAALRRRLA
jgi:hypothetical protein